MDVVHGVGLRGDVLFSGLRARVVENLICHSVR